MTSERLKQCRNMIGLSQAAISKELGISQSTYARYELGGGIPENVLNYLSKKRINLNWLFTGEGPMLLNGDVSDNPPEPESEDTVLIPMTNVKLSAGLGSTWEEGSYTGEMIPIPKKIARNYRSAFLVAAEVRGNSMEPTLKDGETVVYAKGQMDGDGIYAIAIYDELYIKRLSLDLLDKKVLIISDNAKYPTKEYPMDKEGLEVLGKVVFWIHME